LLPCLRADFAVLETYTYQHESPLSCQVIGFQGRQDQEVSPTEMQAWQQQTNANFYLHTLPGNHFFLHSHQLTLLQLLNQEMTQILSTS
jgi:medium-chain acyl-[acyl-carrier-protein] hydrolase